MNFQTHPPLAWIPAEEEVFADTGEGRWAMSFLVRILWHVEAPTKPAVSSPESLGTAWPSLIKGNLTNKASLSRAT